MMIVPYVRPFALHRYHPDFFLAISRGSRKNPLMKIRTSLLRFVLPVVFLVTIAAAQTLPTGVERRATMAGITEYAYPNGLRVLLLPDAGSATMTVNMIYLVGSRHEGYGETGMAHLLEHMNFILSTDGRNIKQELTGRGATWNGTTSYDRTNYYETFKASEDNLKWALGLEADRMVKMRIEKPLLDTEMTVVRNEFERGENSVTSVLAERVLSTAFLWHNYGKSTIGSRQDIEKVPIDRLAAFYRKYYQPDNAVLVVAGPIDPANTLNLISQSLGVIPRPTRKLDETYTVEPTQDGERYVELRRVGKGRNIMIAYHAPALAHPDDGVIEVMEGVLIGPGGSGRLYKALVESKKALSVGMGVMELHDPGLITVSVSLNDDQSVDEAKKIVYDTIANLVKEPPTRRGSRPVEELHCSTHGSGVHQFPVSRHEHDRHGRCRRLAAVVHELRRDQTRHGGRCRPRCENILQGFQSDGRGFQSGSGAGSHERAGSPNDGSAAARLSDQY